MKPRPDTIFFTDGSRVDKAKLETLFTERIEFDLVKDQTNVTAHDILKALSMTVRDMLTHNWLSTQHAFSVPGIKKVNFLSLEFLIGRMLGSSLINLGLYEQANKMLSKFGFDIESVIAEEADMGLGNGGLGRLAACFMDSLSTLGLPGFGYGIRYEFGIFEQDLDNGYQIEKPDHWLRYGNPWEVVRPELTYRVKFNGHSSTNGIPEWSGTDDVLAVAYDIPVPGFRNRTVNTLRLWGAKSTDEFNLEYFNQGNYLSAVENKSLSEAISKVLYPNDSTPPGKALRFKQQYFFVSATLQDIIKNFKAVNTDLRKLPECEAIHLNDTHPAIAIPELMRLLLDTEGFPWDEAWGITKKTFAFTNHTILPEALQEWPSSLVRSILPRHMQIIEEIDRRMRADLTERLQGNKDAVSRMAVIGSGEDPPVRMSNLAIYGSHSVNGVAELHTEILKKYIFRDFCDLEPDKFINITNGVTVRRFLKQANPKLSGLISEKISDKWVTDLSGISKIESYSGDPDFRQRWHGIKQENKLRLAKFIQSSNGIAVNPDSIFDSQVKRFHEYKRQLLNVLHVITLYNRIKENPETDIVPRTVIISGKAAPSYSMAKLIIKLINCAADTINADPGVGDKLKLVFLKNYGVSLAELVIPASDVSEQISTAGFEASGTGNMKFALNGALTVGTLDGANIEIKDQVGEENIFIFGLTSSEIREMRSTGYNPGKYYENDTELKKAVNMIRDNYFNQTEHGIFQPIIDELLGRDYYFVMADYRSYADTQMRVENEYRDRELWVRKSILNVSRMTKFSGDRAVREYADKIWKIKKVN